MELSTQNYLRVILPGVFLYGLLVILCWTTKWCDLAIPQSWEEVSKLLAAVVLGVIYSLTSLRELSNRPYHFDVNQNILQGLTEPFKGQIPNLDKLDWKDLRHVFYYFVENDESLKMKSSIIRFNGLMWTSIADLRVVSLAGIAIFLISVACSHYSGVAPLHFDEGRAYVPIFLLTVLFLSTFLFSQITTDRHRRLGDEQCEYIVLHHRDELKNKLVEVVHQHTGNHRD